MLKQLATSLIVIAGLAASAAADDPKKGDAPATQPTATKPVPPPPATGDRSAEVKAGTGVENKALVGEATEFTSGTRVWVWSRVKGVEPGTFIKHVWKKDGAEVWSAKLKIGSKKWTTNSRRNVKAGDWTVEVVDADGTTIGSVSFTVL